MYSVILELDGSAPEVLATSRSFEQAKIVAITAAAANNARGGKVTIAKPDSADQLQRYSKGWHRQDPDQPAVGEDVVIWVPTAKGGKR